MKKIDTSWYTRLTILKAAGYVFNIATAYFVLLSLIASTLIGQLQSESHTEAATCSLATTISTTVEITPNSSDNIIDCSGQDITILDGGTLILKSFTTSDTTTSNDGGVILKVSTLTVNVGGKISADGQGYAPGATDGGSALASTGIAAGSGGGNGGAGGSGNTSGGTGNVVGAAGEIIANGYKESPTALGGAGGNAGGGGAGGSGGGAIKIMATGAVQIDGSITANGTNGAKSADDQTSGGGGAGGSIWILADSFAGAGTVTAKGGGTDQSVSYYGGGGGGGRIVMIAMTASTFPVLNVSVEQGLGSQNGGIGTLIGPGVKPPAPTVLRLFEMGSATNRVGRELLVGEIAGKNSIVFASDLPAGANSGLEIEYREVGEAFQNVPNGAQTISSTNLSCTTLGTGNDVPIAAYCGFATVQNITKSKQYKWQARISRNQVPGDWVQFGGNTVDDADFTIAGPAVGIVFARGNNQSVPAGEFLPTKASIRVVDSAGFGVPFYADSAGFIWGETLTGGGSISNVMTTADKWGELSVDWKVGTVAGANTNTLSVRKHYINWSLTFTESVIPGPESTYKITVPPIVLVDSPTNITISAADQYGNVISGVNHDVTLSAVSAYSTSTPGLGVFAPTSATLVNGTATVAMTYSYTESIKVKATHVSNANIVGYSGGTTVVNQLGYCPAVIISQNTVWRAIDAPGGVFDCRGLGTFTVSTGVTLTLQSYDSGDATWGNDYGVTILADGLDIQGSAIVSADAKGYLVGPGGGSCLGASYGGYGAYACGVSKKPYGSIYTPQDLGSGSGYGGAYGGGAIKFVITGNSNIDGTISSNNANAVIDWAGSGTGGSIWVDTGSLSSTSGTGVLRANSLGGRGSAGRIALYYGSNTGFNLDTDHLQAYGSSTHRDDNRSPMSAPGTVYVENKSVNAPHEGALLVDGNSITYNYGAYVLAGDYALEKIKVRREGGVTFEGDSANQKVTLRSSASLVGDTTKPQVNVGGQIIFAPTIEGETLSVNGVNLNVRGDLIGATNFAIGDQSVAGVTLYAKTWAHSKDVPWNFGNVTVGSQGYWYMQGYDSGDTIWTDDYGVTVNAANVTVVNGGQINADGLGWYSGPGGGGCMGASFGGYGAYACSPALKPYGSIYGTLEMGSGSGYGLAYGGGAIKLNVSDTLTVNGMISANNANRVIDWAGSGSGGSLWITTNHLVSATGAGIMRVNSFGGRGSAGRIALYYADNNGYLLDTNHLQAYGSTTHRDDNRSPMSGNGTVYVENTTTDVSHHGILMADNNGTTYTNGAYVLAGDYTFKQISAVREGSITFEGNSATQKVTITDGAQLVGDASKPKIVVNGLFDFQPVVPGSVLTINGVNLVFAGEVQGVTDLQMGNSQVGAITLNAKTWAHSKDVPWTFGNVSIGTQGYWYMQGFDNGNTNWTDDYGVTVNATNVTIANGGQLNSDGLGWYSGPGGGGCMGASFGGYGAYACSPALKPYGSIYGTLEMGSGSGYGLAYGGGSVKLTVSNTLTVNGVISANNANRVIDWAGSGSGGSLWIDTNHLVSATGAGIMRVNSLGGRGSAGRIALYYADNNGYLLDTSHLQAYGSTTHRDDNRSPMSGNGTVYVENKSVDASHQGILMSDNNGTVYNNGAYVLAGDYTFKQIQVKREGGITFEGYSAADKVTVTNGNGLVGDTTKPKITVNGLFNYQPTIPGSVLGVNGVDLGFQGDVAGISDMEIGTSSVAAVTLYAKTWAHSKTVPWTFGNVTVGSQGYWYMQGYDSGDNIWTDDYGVPVNATNVTVLSGGQINADGRGWYTGPGGGNCLGASFGGYGATACSASPKPYGSIYGTLEMGSGSSYGLAYGGGAIKLTVSDTLQVDGFISANNANRVIDWAASGSGGSLWIDTNHLVSTAGAGIMRVNSLAGRGSAGRIALYYNDNTGFLLDTNHLQAYGSSTNRDDNRSPMSGNGTVYIENKGVDASRQGTLLMDNNGTVYNNGAYILAGDYTFKQIKVRREGGVTFEGTSAADRITVTDANALVGDSTKPKITVNGLFRYQPAVAGSVLSVNGVDLGFQGDVEGISDMEIGTSQTAAVTLYAKTWAHSKDVPWGFGNVTVGGQGFWYMQGYDTGDSIWTNDYGVNVTATNVTVATGGQINADGRGYMYGPGSSGCAGASFGGYGGLTTGCNMTGKPPYGDMYGTLELGSGGSENTTPGGGAIKLTVSDTLTVNGAISATSRKDRWGGWWTSGSGGSIWIDTNNLISVGGSGIIDASASRGKGSGGIIALYFNNNNGFLINDTHLLTRGAQDGYEASIKYQTTGGPGTVYVEDRSKNQPKAGSLIVSNGTGWGRAKALEARDYEFGNVYIGPNISIGTKTDLSKYTEGFIRPPSHEALSENSTTYLLHYNEVMPSSYRNEVDQNKNGIIAPALVSVDGKFNTKGQQIGDSTGIKFPEIQLPVEWTIDMWVKFPLPATGAGWRGLIAKDGGTYYPLMIHGNGEIGVYNAGWYSTGYNTNNLPAGWQHIAVTAKSGKSQFYINGQYVGVSNTVVTQPVSIIGNYCATPGCNQNAGQIDEVRISNIAFTEAEIAQMAGATSQSTVIGATIALWHLDEDVNYITNTKNEGRIAATIATGEGKYTNGGYYDGSKGYVTLPSGQSDFSSGFSFETWAKPTNSGDWARFFDMGNAAASDNVFLAREGGSNNLVYGVYLGGAGQTALYYSNGIINNEWHHYAVTVSSTGYARIYRDGIEQVKGQIALPNNIVRAKAYVGKSNWSNALFQGYMDDTHFFNRELTSDEVLAHMQGYTLSESRGIIEQSIGRGVTLRLTGNFTLEANSIIDGSGTGFPSGQGVGFGHNGIGYSGGGGGSNGGQGGSGQGDGLNAPAVGGQKYGDQLLPFTIGSGGGRGSTGALGGTGGGSLAIVAKGVYNEQTKEYVDGVVTIHGTIKMDGTIGLTGSPGGGGGSGGSILVHGNTCTIDGTLQAKGGEGGNSDIDGGSGGGGRVSVLYNVGPCNVTGTVTVSEGRPSDPANYSAQVGQVGTYPPEPNSVPWPSQYKEQFEVYDDTVQTQQLSPITKTVVSYASAGTIPNIKSVLGIVESSIPLGGIINGTTVTLKADAYDAGARAISPKNLKIQVELKPVTSSFDGSTNLYESGAQSFVGGQPIVMSVTISNLVMGTSYKWRVRTVNVDSNLYSDWQDFGNNGNLPDFSITTVASIGLALDKSVLLLPESASITVVARNQLGNIDPSYRGTVRFLVNSATATLPGEYTFTQADGGQHTFANSLKFFENGTFTLLVEDIVNPALTDSAQVTVNNPEVPFLSIGATVTTIVLGETTTISWSSNVVSNLSIDQGIGSVSGSGSQDVTPTQLGDITYTITGVTQDNQTLSASVVIHVISSQAAQETPIVTPSVTIDSSNPNHNSVTVTPSPTKPGKPTPTETNVPIDHTVTPIPSNAPAALCPTIYLFTVDKRIVKENQVVYIGWDVRNADKVTIDAFSGGLPLTGSSSVVMSKSQEVTLFASKKGCVRTDKIRIEVVNSFPWEGASGVLVGLVLLEAVGMQVGVLQGNVWYALLAVIDRKKKRQPWGVVYDSVTKSPIVRAVVRLWDAEKGVLMDTVVTDANGIFKLTPKIGKYVVKVNKSGYTFPSKLVSGSSDTGFTDVYRGEVVEITADDQVIMMSIPIDPVKDESKRTLKSIMSYFESVIAVLDPILLVAGFVYSIVATIMYPLIYNFVVLSIYCLLAVIKWVAYKSKPRVYGMVTDTEDQVVSGLEIGIFDKDFLNLIARTFSNKKGAYNFVTRNQDYYLQVLDTRYKIMDRHAKKEGILISRAPGRSNVRLVTENLLVQRVRSK